MANKICCLCGDKITKKNDTNEHIIPNAVGGRLKVRGFICDPCNNSTGHTWDTALAKQMEQMCLLFNIKRERGSVQSLNIPTDNGEHIRFNPDGTMGLTKPQFSEFVEGRDVSVSISANSVKEAKKMLKGVKRKYPKIDTDKFLEEGKITSSYPEGNLRFSHHFGEELAGKSSVKTAMAFAALNGIEAGRCDVALAYLMTADSSKCFGHYYDGDFVLNRPDDAVFHCVNVTGIPSENLLVSYVEYFGFQRMIICLSENYNGPELSYTYAIDPVAGEEIDIQVNVQISVGQLHKCYSFEAAPDGAIQAMNKVIPIARKRHWEDERNRVIERAVEYAFANCGVNEGEILGEEGAKKLADLTMDQLQPFLLRAMGVPVEHIHITERPINPQKPYSDNTAHKKK
ncbi:hypothetical protein GCM10011332_21280 [Terasakiella brassicae]|uniref:HNH endonuclease 5 domain-containing protein n=1 Tax=Terasakiella brassicae TaxID=1634917 RepID=A0A917C0U1_9PROT|nr:HNH endonuclease [Terasakiella brassicae]GGF66936.1 hypothetical protein GCM10011332_21280 [Terasakiella brassicae]